MYEPELQETGGSGDLNRSSHRELYKDLVQMVPLVHSLIEQAGKSSYTRTASMVYTKKPARPTLNPKTVDLKSRNTAQSIPVKKRKDKTNNDNLFATSSTSSMDQEEELIALREQVQDLQNKLLEKDELLKPADHSKTQIASICAEVEELKLKVAEKDSLYNATQSQLSDAKVTLADQQTAIEKLQWEAMTSTKKVEKLQEDLGSMQGDIVSYMSLLESLAKTTPIMSLEDYDVVPCHLPHPDDWDEINMQKSEEVKRNYMASVNYAKEKQNEDSIAAAANVRLSLRSFVSKPKKGK